MKTTNPISRVVKGSSLGLIIAVAAWLAAPTSVFGQIKGGQRLIELNRREPLPAVETGKSAPMPCAKCKDVVVVRRNTEAKGGQALIAGGVPTKNVASHLCGGCGNKWEMVGHGKKKVSVAVHTCTECKAKKVAATGTK